MTNRELIDFCNEKIFTQVTGPEMFEMKCLEVIKTVKKWRRNNGFPKEMEARVTNNFLYINNIPVGRIAPAPNKNTEYDERAYYWEGRILERQERNC